MFRGFSEGNDTENSLSRILLLSVLRFGFYAMLNYEFDAQIYLFFYSFVKIVGSISLSNSSCVRVKKTGHENPQKSVLCFIWLIYFNYLFDFQIIEFFLTLLTLCLENALFEIVFYLKVNQGYLITYFTILSQCVREAAK